MKQPLHHPSDLRKFGLLLGSIFILLFGLTIPWFRHHHFPTWPWIAAAVLWLPAVIYPKSLTWLYQAWMKIGDVLGAINSRIILGILFFLVITPIGIVRRVFGQDTMGKHYEPALTSYRTPMKPKPNKHMEKPF